MAEEMSRWGYRFFDILFAALATLLFAPLLLVIAIILRLTNGEVLYLQHRVGKGGKIFSVYKFATMIKNSEYMQHGTITLKNDSRVFPFGRFLRKTKLNELPQLFNILKGDMSVVGPRPLPMERYQTYSDRVKQQIAQVKPGLSGIGSILFRNEEEILSQVEASDKVAFYDRVIAPYKGRVEEWFVANQSLGLYFLIIFMTLFVVLFPNIRVDYSKIFQGLPPAPDALKGLL